jgi:hypothetical protein
MKLSYDAACSAILILPFVGSSIYIPSTGVPPFPLLAYSFAIFYLAKHGVRKDRLTLICGLLIVFALSSSLQSIYWIAVDSINIRLNSFLGVVFGVTLFLAGSNFFNKTRARYLDLTLGFFLLLILGFFYIQFLSQFLLASKIDFMKPISGDAQRHAGHLVAVEGLGTFSRISGIFAEPAVHAYMTIMVLTAMLFRKSASNLLFFLSLCSVWLSLSASGIALSLIPIWIKLVTIKRKDVALILSVITLVFVCFGVLSTIFEPQINRILNWQGDASSLDRLRFIGFLNENPSVLLFGFGFFADIRLLIPPAGFIASLVFHLGLPLAFVFLILMAYLPFKAQSKWRFFIFILLALFFGYPVSSPFFWISYTILYVSMRCYPQGNQNSASVNMNKSKGNMLANPNA